VRGNSGHLSKNSISDVGDINPVETEMGLSLKQIVDIKMTKTNMSIETNKYFGSRTMSDSDKAMNKNHSFFLNRYFGFI
jgi:hypothetical protein